MNQKQARKLRKLAYEQCNKEQGSYLVQLFKKLIKVKDKEVEQVNGTIRWRPDSFMGIYRRLKREYQAK